MQIKFIIDEDFINYKDISMFIGFPKCTFKCDKECGLQICQNSGLAKMPTYEISAEEIVERYINNSLSKAIVIGGLEPFDTEKELYYLIRCFRWKTNDPIIIYTGYTEEELQKSKSLVFLENKNIIVKFGRFIPNQSLHYDNVLGVNLASDNQYAKEI